MTSYYISLGYQSGYAGFVGDKSKCWEKLEELWCRLATDPERIKNEALRLGANEHCEDNCCSIDDYCIRYKEGGDLTLRITKPVGDEEGYIVQYASGSRELKEQVRRAFCRLLIEDAHRAGIEVNLRVS